MSTERNEHVVRLRKDPDLSRLYDRTQGVAAGMAFATNGLGQDEIEWFVLDARVRDVEPDSPTVREAMLGHSVLAEMVREIESELTPREIRDFDAYWEGLAEGVLARHGRTSKGLESR